MASINFITIHTTGNRNATATALSHTNYQFNGSGGGQTSWHYTVDKDEIWQSFEDDSMCWHAGDGNGPGNSTSIGIEICVNNRDGFVLACQKTAWLTAELLKKHNLSIKQVVQHNHWSGKNCPAELRNGEWGISWGVFIDMVIGAMDSDSNKKDDIISTNEPSPWAKNDWQWAVEHGITDGTRPTETCTREQVVAMIARALKKL